ncbi:MAG: hypothetical protein QM756_02560 [Polyangiaceae bacterium]
MLRLSTFLVLIPSLAWVGCSSGETTGPGTGGKSNSNGGSGAGGTTNAAGGTTGFGGFVGNGGSSNGGSSNGGSTSGGSTSGGSSNGGSSNGGSSNGGSTSGGSTSGGSTSGGSSNGGASAGGSSNGGSTSGGATAGGSSATGGSATGGSTTGGAATGGRANTGGAASGGAASGGAASGGAASGGAASGGAASGGSTSGGSTSGGSTSTCARAVGSCTAPTVKVTDVSLGIAVTAYGGEGDTDPLPMAIAAKPSGGSRIAWRGTDSKVYIGELDCDDKLVGTPFSIPAIDLQDLYADDTGGVVLVTREATNGGTDNCGSGSLCGGTSSPCRAMFLVRFNANGTVAWETQVTNLSGSLAGYQNGARFVWWYQHHGRLAFDGTNYAAYFGTAITVNNGSCVDIHEGDRMQVVSGTGQLLTGHDSFEVGCSHAWTSRIVWDPRTSHFAMVCATDNSCRIATPNPYRTVAAGTCDGTLFGGDIVLSSTPGYWTAWSQGGTIRLQHFTMTTSATTPDTSVANAGSSQHPHLIGYGTGRMLVAWGSGTSMTAQVRSNGAAAETIGSTFTIAVNDHSYQAFKAYSDGSVAYAAAGANNTSIKIARVMPCN